MVAFSLFYPNFNTAINTKNPSFPPYKGEMPKAEGFSGKILYFLP